MNKKFLSAILFGALMVTSTGTFVSCKDYDDDIENLQGQVDTNKSAISALESQLSSLTNAGAEAKAKAESALAAAEAAKAAGDEAKAAAEAAAAAAAQAKVDAIAEATKQVEALKAIVEANKLEQDELETVVAAISGQIEAIDADINTLEALVKSEDTKILAQIAAVKADLEEQLAALQAGNGTASEEAVNAILGLQEQLDGLTAQVTPLFAIVGELEEAVKGNQETLMSYINQLDAQIAATNEYMDEELAGLWAEINGEGANSIRTQLGQLALQLGDLNTLNVLVGRRLTSIALIPTQHINGIPAITINTLMYTPQKYTAMQAHQEHTALPVLDHVDAGKARFISSNNNIVKFHLNPSKGINANDILLPSFDCITSTNITRSVSDKLAGLNSPIMAVDQPIAIENGVLTLKVQKSAEALESYIGTDGYAHDGDFNKESFYMASLKVPVAEHLWTAAEKEAKAKGEIDGVYVNSEYNRVEEIVRIPYLVNSKTDFKKTMDGEFADETQGTGDAKIYVHYHDSICLYQSANEELVDVKWSYNKPLDLKTLVKVCAIDANLEGETAPASHESHVDLEDYESYGLAFRFALAGKEYLQGDRKTDEQQFAQIDNSINGMMTSKVYGVGETGDSRAAIGREPIVRVSLIDTNNGNALVAQRYIKVRWTETQVGEQIIPGYNFDEEQYVTCMTMFRQLMSKEMNELIYHQVKLITDGGETSQSISKENFHKIYTKINIESLKKDGAEILGTVAASTDAADFDEKTAQEVDGFETILNNKDVVFAFLPDALSNTSYNLVWAMSPKAVGTLKDLKASEFEITVKYVDPTGVHGSVQQTFKQTIAIPTQSFSYQGTYWKDGIGEGVFNVNPIVYNTNNDQPALKDPHNYDNCELKDYSHIEADLVNGFIYKSTNKKPANLDQFIQYIRGCADVKFIFDYERFGNYAHLANYVVDETSTKLFYKEEIAVATKTTSEEQDKGNITVGKGNVIAEYVQKEGIAATINNFMGVDADINTDKKDYAWEYDETLGSGKNECYSIIRLHELDDKNATDAAKALVGKKVPVNLVVEYNEYNVVAEQEFEVYFINPLEIDGNINDNFVDAVINGDFLSVAENFTFTDWNGYSVAKETVSTTNEKKAYAHELYDYYAVRNVVFATDDVKTSLTLQGNTYIHKDGVTNGELPAKASLKQMNWVENTDKSQATVVTEDPTHLAYFNYEGTPVNVDYQLFVDVKVDYKWGTLNRDGLAIWVKPAQGTDDVNKGE